MPKPPISALARKVCTDRKRAAFYAAIYASHLAKWPRVRGRIWAYPERPGRPYLVWKLALLAGYRITGPTGAPIDGAIRYYHSDSDVHQECDPQAINGRCIDIRKRRVDQAFGAVFGYGASVDPTTYRGEAVRKSNGNASHDGIVVQCPVRPDEIEPGCVYQKLIDNRSGADEVVDRRVGIIGGRPAYVLRKYRPRASRFDPASNSRVVIEPLEAVFSAAEATKLARFCAELGLDLGELDVLRDQDGRIYVVDANKTPAFSHATVISMRGLRLMRSAAKTFRRFLETRGVAPGR
jgi:hypothetical protein